ncbi:hypothetical protein ABFV47_27180 [Mycolicibacterium fortuitum]|uniref:hypothetical protein n=1 Tax=Mycolicibacterium fortuitum TaxID=1766 RepID=UPI0009BF067F|nr:hypothetical protein [Mycolicibacterium fortuitum]
MTATVALVAAGWDQVPAMHVQVHCGLQEPSGTDRPTGASNSGMDEFSEDLRGPRIPAAVEAYMAEQRSWWRLLRGTGAVGPAEAAQELRRWVESG